MQEPFQSLLVWIVIIGVLVVAALVLHDQGVIYIRSMLGG